MKKSHTNTTTCTYGCLVPMETLHHPHPIESLGRKPFSIPIQTFFHSCVDALWHTSYAPRLTQIPSGGFGHHLSTKICDRLTLKFVYIYKILVKNGICFYSVLYQNYNKGRFAPWTMKSNHGRCPFFMVWLNGPTIMVSFHNNIQLQSLWAPY